MKKIAGLSEIIQDYNYYIFDIWGVIHDGSKLYPNVLETLNYLRKIIKKFAFYQMLREGLQKLSKY